jgi:hypothetical protein
VRHTDGFVAIAAQTLFCSCGHWGDGTLLTACSSEFFGSFSSSDLFRGKFYQSFCFDFFPISHLLHAKRMVAHFEQYPVWSAGNIWQYAQEPTSLGFLLAAGLLCFV